MPTVDMNYLPYPWYPYHAPHPAYSGHTTTTGSSGVQSTTSHLHKLTAERITQMEKNFEQKIDKLYGLLGDNAAALRRIGEQVEEVEQILEARIHAMKWCDELDRRNAQKRGGKQ